MTTIQRIEDVLKPLRRCTDRPDGCEDKFKCSAQPCGYKHKQYDTYALLDVIGTWLDAALSCKDFVWDPLQHEAATQTLEEYKQLYKGKFVSFSNEDKDKDAEILKLHRELAAARLDAKLGWERAASANESLMITQRKLVEAVDKLNEPKNIQLGIAGYNRNLYEER